MIRLVFSGIDVAGALLLLGLAGCQVVAGVEVRDEVIPGPGSGGDVAGAGGATNGPTEGGAGAELDLRYCAELPEISLPTADEPDWSCVDPVRNLARDVGPLTITGFFANYDSIDALLYCRVPGDPRTCGDAEVTLTGDRFELTSSQEGYGLLRWTTGGRQGEATLWHSVVNADSFYAGETYLTTRDDLALIAAVGNLPMDPELGAAFILIRDCSRSPAAGVWFGARSIVGGDVMGEHFSIVSAFPSPDPTIRTGFGGLVNLRAGFVDVVAYVGDGCIVAETRALVEPERMNYVLLAPNGLGRAAPGGAGGAGGNHP